MSDSNTENNVVEEKNVGDSILLSVKKILSLTADNTDFDVDIIMHINSVLSILNQLGVGPSDGFYIENDTKTWTDYLGEDQAYINLVKSYMAAKVRILFDPPVSSAVMDSLNRICGEFEWRANVAAENKEHEEATSDESGSDNT